MEVVAVHNAGVAACQLLQSQHPLALTPRTPRLSASPHRRAARYSPRRRCRPACTAPRSRRGRRLRSSWWGGGAPKLCAAASVPCIVLTHVIPRLLPVAPRRVQRLPGTGLPSSRLGLEVLSGVFPPFCSHTPLLTLQPPCCQATSTTLGLTPTWASPARRRLSRWGRCTHRWRHGWGWARRPPGRASRQRAAMNAHAALLHLYAFPISALLRWSVCSCPCRRSCHGRQPGQLRKHVGRDAEAGGYGEGGQRRLGVPTGALCSSRRGPRRHRRSSRRRRGRRERDAMHPPQEEPHALHEG